VTGSAKNLEKFTRDLKTEIFQLSVWTTSKSESGISVSLLQYLATIQSRKLTFKLFTILKFWNFLKKMKSIYWPWSSRLAIWESHMAFLLHLGHLTCSNVIRKKSLPHPKTSLCMLICTRGSSNSILIWIRTESFTSWQSLNFSSNSAYFVEHGSLLS